MVPHVSLTKSHMRLVKNAVASLLGLLSPIPCPKSYLKTKALRILQHGKTLVIQVSLALSFPLHRSNSNNIFLKNMVASLLGLLSPILLQKNAFIGLLAVSCPAVDILCNWIKINWGPLGIEISKIQCLPTNHFLFVSKDPSMAFHALSIGS